jgi:organic hydroperoxide reductase OsmC/OhrA
LSEKQEKENAGKVQEVTSSLTLTWQKDLAFTVSFDVPTIAPLKADELPPQGSGEGVNATRLLGAAVGDCLSSSLAFCLGRNKIELKRMKTEVEIKNVRNETGRLRVNRIKVDLYPELKSSEDSTRSKRCQEIFQDYCIVTESVRKGIPVEVNIRMPKK